MEESEKRRERLRAMRMEAAQAEASSNAESLPGPGSLSNPLLGDSATQPEQQQSYATPRFDFYTDPMSAFSSIKKWGQHDNTHPHDSTSTMARPALCSPGPSNLQVTGSHQLQNSSSFDPRMYRPQGPYNNTAYGGPRGMVNPLPPHHIISKDWSGSGFASGYHNSAPHNQQSPRGMVNSFPMMHQGNAQTWNSPGGTFNYNSPSNASGGGGQIYNPGFRPVRNPNLNYGQGRPHWHASSPSPRPGSGRGANSGPGPGLGRDHRHGANSSGRGRGFHTGGSDAARFYHKSMDEDPWEQLQPSLWKSLSLKGASSSKSWLPESITVKKPRVSEPSNQSSSQPSLAEYLAASFNEVVTDTPNS